MWWTMETTKVKLTAVFLLAWYSCLEAGTPIYHPWTEIEFRTEGGEYVVAKMRNEHLVDLQIAIPGFSVEVCDQALEGIESPDLSRINLMTSFGTDDGDTTRSVVLEVPFYTDDEERLAWFLIGSNGIERLVWESPSRRKLIEETFPCRGSVDER